MDSGAMQMLGATGGMIMMFLSVLMMILSILVPFFVWRIWKWSYTTSQELQQLNEKFDQLLTLQQGGAKAFAEPAPAAPSEPAMPSAAWTETPAEEEAVEEDQPTEDADPLASAFDTTEATEEEPATDFSVADTTEEEPEEASGFEFSVSPEDAFGEDEAEESGGFEFDEEEEPSAEEDATEDDPFAGAAIGDDESADDFAFDEEEGEDSEVANLNQEFDNAFAQTDEPAEQSDEDTFGGFAEEETATEEAPADEEPPAEEPPAQEDPDDNLFAGEAETTEEEQPDIIPLEADPNRPTVSLARCGKCDHKLAYKETLSGKKARCPSCQSAFVLP